MKLDQSGGLSLAYLVHDLEDAAVRRRMDLLVGEGLIVGLGGFRRHADGDHDMAAGCAVKMLHMGRTMDARLGQRAAAVLKWMLSPSPIKRLCADAPVIVARNLEMLMLAWRVRAPKQRLVYECLDIHRLMLGTGGKSRIMRWMERWLLRRTDLIIVSSPAFAKDYFSARQGRNEGILLVENKVPVERRRSDNRAARGARTQDGALIWTIGWFGMLRCRKTLEQLTELAGASRGRIEVVIAGIASPAEFPDFSGQVAGCEGLRYLGPFKRDELHRLYREVDFVWAVDYFEEGLNSDWLLPNRLYEGLAHGVVPIALNGVETGRWLRRHGVGLLVDAPLLQLPARLSMWDRCEHERMREAIACLPEGALYQTAGERRDIAAAITGLRHG